ncbi:MAG: hypothetical protein ACJ79A_03015 [Gemmatimonadaceae bacterium]
MSRWKNHEKLALCALALASARALSAQNAPASPPADTAVPVATGRPAYLRSIRAVAPPVILGQTPHRVLLAPAATAAVLDTVDFGDSLSRACPAATSAPPTEYSPGGVAVDATKYFVVIAATASSTGEGCAAAWNASAASMWSGLALGVRAGEPAFAPRELHLFANGIEVEPALHVSRPLLERHGAEWRPAGTQLRYYFPMSVLGAWKSGTRPQLAVRVSSATNVPTSYELSAADGERMQFAYAAFRLAMTGGSGRPVRLTARHPVTPELRELLATAATRPDSSALHAAELVSITPSGAVPVYQRDVAAMLVAEVLTQHGDSIAARSLVSSVGARHTCLAPPAGASTALVAAVAASRRASCREHSPLASFGLGLVVAGGGHWLSGSRTLGVLATGLISALLVSAYSQDVAARNTYARYQQSRLDSQATDLFAFATVQRAAARRRAQAGVILLGTDAALAALLTVLDNREVARGRL